ncbi:hypothetical protein [Streptomyces murinus]|uniref:hypothetical protein n=1 Tax=Streptomyces murinus TaxID=33900 RepID=UPI003D6952BF
MPAARNASATSAKDSPSPSAAPTQPSAPACTSGIATAPPHSASTRQGRACTTRTSASAVRTRPVTGRRSGRTTVSSTPPR